MHTGSFINLISEQSKQDEPAVGMGATACHWTDREAFTIVEVCADKCADARRNRTLGHIRIQRDIATRADKNGMSDAQSYTYEADPNGSILDVYLYPTTKSRVQGWRLSRGGAAVIINRRMSYHDYSF